MTLHFLDLSMGKIAYRHIGEGPTIVFLHGFLGNSEVWWPAMQALQQRFHCIAPDLLGFGESAKPRLKYVIDHQVEFLHALILALKLSEVALVGYSYGGWTAAAYGVAYPQWLKQLVLVAPAGIRDDQFVGRYTHLRPLLWDTPLVDGALHVLTTIARSIGQGQALADLHCTRRALMAQPVARSFLMDRLRPEDAIDTVETKIHQISVPTRVVAGAQDATIPLWHCQTYRDRIAQATLTVLPDAGHDLLQTHMDRLIHEIADHLGSVEVGQKAAI